MLIHFKTVSPTWAVIYVSIYTDNCQTASPTGIGTRLANILTL